MHQTDRVSSLPRVRRSRWVMPVAPGSRVTRLELFYDVIFVFAFLNVTALVSRHLSWLGFAGDRRGIKARVRQEERAAEEAVSAWRRQHL